MKKQVNKKSKFTVLIVSIVVLIFVGIFIMKNNSHPKNEKKPTIITVKAENYDTLVSDGQLVSFGAVGEDRKDKPPVIINISKASQGNGKIFVILEPISIYNFGGVLKQTKLFLGQTVPIYHFYKDIYNDLRNNKCDTEKTYQTGTVSLVSLEEDGFGGQEVTLVIKKDE